MNLLIIILVVVLTYPVRSHKVSARRARILKHGHGFLTLCWMCGPVISLLGSRGREVASDDITNLVHAASPFQILLWTSIFPAPISLRWIFVNLNIGAIGVYFG